MRERPIRHFSVVVKSWKFWILVWTSTGLIWGFGSGTALLWCFTHHCGQKPQTFLITGLEEPTLWTLEFLCAQSAFVVLRAMFPRPCFLHVLKTKSTTLNKPSCLNHNFISRKQGSVWCGALLTHPKMNSFTKALCWFNPLSRLCWCPGICSKPVCLRH